MKIVWRGKTEPFVLTKNKIYDVLAVEKGWYRVIDDSGEDYLYPPEQFEEIEDENKIPREKTKRDSNERIYIENDNPNTAKINEYMKLSDEEWSCVKI